MSDLPLAPGRGLGQPHISKGTCPSRTSEGRDSSSPAQPQALGSASLWPEETVPAAVPTTALFGQGSCSTVETTDRMWRWPPDHSFTIYTRIQVEWRRKSLSKLPHTTKGRVQVDLILRTHRPLPACARPHSNPQRPSFPVSIILWVNSSSMPALLLAHIPEEAESGFSFPDLFFTVIPIGCCYFVHSKTQPTIPTQPLLRTPLSQGPWW